MEYYIYQGTSQSNLSKVATVTDKKTYTASNLNANTTYYFAVSAWNGIRESAKSNILTVKTSAIPATNITLTISNKALEVGGTVQAQVTVTPTNHTDGTVTYESSVPTVATVGRTTGLITAKAKGTTNITAKVGAITSTAVTITVYEALVTVTNLQASSTTANSTTLTWV